MGNAAKKPVAMFHYSLGGYTDRGMLNSVMEMEAGSGGSVCCWWVNKPVVSQWVYADYSANKNISAPSIIVGQIA